MLRRCFQVFSTCCITLCDWSYGWHLVCVWNILCMFQFLSRWTLTSGSHHACDVRQTWHVHVACGCVISSLHVHLSHSLHRVPMLSVVNAVVSQLCLCHGAVSPSASQQAWSCSIQGFVPPDSVHDPASLNQQSTDCHWTLYSAPGHVAPPGDCFDRRCYRNILIYLLTYKLWYFKHTEPPSVHNIPAFCAWYREESDKKDNKKQTKPQTDTQRHTHTETYPHRHTQTLTGHRKSIWIQQFGPQVQLSLGRTRTLVAVKTTCSFHLAIQHQTRIRSDVKRHRWHLNQSQQLSLTKTIKTSKNS